MDAVKNLQTKVAKKVLQETLSVKKGGTVTVESWNNGLEFARVLLAEARAMGCDGEEKAAIMGLTVQQVEEPQLSASLVNFEQISSSAGRLSSSLTDGSE